MPTKMAPQDEELIEQLRTNHGKWPNTSSLLRKPEEGRSLWLMQLASSKGGCPGKNLFLEAEGVYVRVKLFHLGSRHYACKGGNVPVCYRGDTVLPWVFRILGPGIHQGFQASRRKRT